MATNATTFSEKWELWFTELADPRTHEWFMMASPVPCAAIVALYLYFVLKVGPEYMKDRKPFQLKNTLIVYNLVQVLISAYLVYEGIAVWRHFNLQCQPIDYSENPLALRTAGFCHLYFVAKITELLDTVFFVLRKKDKQVTFLHLYHHSGMPLVTWFIAKYIPGGHVTLYGVINSFVHVVMYSYYMLAAFGPRIHKYLWWKKHITILQLVQFGIAFLHASQLLVHDCGYPRSSVAFALPNAVIFMYLFGDFYRKAYKAERARGRLVSQPVNTNNNDDDNNNAGVAETIVGGKVRYTLFEDDAGLVVGKKGL